MRQTFMTAVSITYILTAKEGLQPDGTVSYIIGAVAAASLSVVYPVILIRKNKTKKTKENEQ